MASNGISTSSIFTSVVTAAKVLLVICVVLAGFAQSDWAMWKEQPFMPHGVPGLLDGAVQVFYAYIGFDAMASTAEETVNPTRTVPYAIIIAMLLSMLIYGVLALAVTSMVPYGTLSKTAPVAGAFEDRHQTVTVIVVSITAVIGLLAGVLINLLAGARL